MSFAYFLAELDCPKWGAHIAVGNVASKDIPSLPKLADCFVLLSIIHILVNYKYRYPYSRLGANNTQVFVQVENAIVSMPTRTRNTDVAMTPRDARAERIANRAQPQSPVASATRGAPAEASPIRQARALTASSGNRGVAHEAPWKPPSPPTPPAPAGAGAEEVAAHVARQDEEILDLQAQLAIEKARTAADTLAATLNKAAAITMSTEAPGVPVGSANYWVDANGKKKKKTNILLKGSKPKNDSRTGLHWPGYCVEGCGCDVCVAKLEEPSKTAMLDVKRVSKKPST